MSHDNSIKPFVDYLGSFMDGVRILYDLLVGKIAHWPDNPNDWPANLRPLILQHVADLRQGYAAVLECTHRLIAPIMDGDARAGNRWSTRFLGAIAELASMLGAGEYSDDDKRLRYLHVLAHDSLLLNLLMQSLHEVSRSYGEIVIVTGDGKVPPALSGDRGMTVEQKAMGILTVHPDWSNKQIATRGRFNVKCLTKKRTPKFFAARKLLAAKGKSEADVEGSVASNEHGGGVDDAWERGKLDGRRRQRKG